MKRLYLIGYPLGHSVSPAMQNAALAACGLRDLYYDKLSLPPERIREVLAVLRAPECAGANVTIPYKEKLLPYMDELSDAAREIGAINTIVRRDGRLIGDNTDAFGFLQALIVNGFSPAGKRTVILGAGGAARAAAWALGTAGVTHVELVNRTPSRAQALAQQVQARFPTLAVEIDRIQAAVEANLIVNATPVGMWPHVDASPLSSRALIRPGGTVFDLVYNPRKTRLLSDAINCGAHAIDGLDMLIYQGARAFEMWTGRTAPIEVMRRAAEAALTAGHIGGD